MRIRHESLEGLWLSSVSLLDLPVRVLSLFPLLSFSSEHNCPCTTDSSCRYILSPYKVSRLTYLAHFIQFSFRLFTATHCTHAHGSVLPMDEMCQIITPKNPLLVPHYATPILRVTYTFCTCLFSSSSHQMIAWFPWHAVSVDGIDPFSFFLFDSSIMVVIPQRKRDFRLSVLCALIF